MHPTFNHPLDLSQFRGDLVSSAILLFGCGERKEEGEKSKECDYF